MIYQTTLFVILVTLALAAARKPRGHRHPPGPKDHNAHEGHENPRGHGRPRHGPWPGKMNLEVEVTPCSIREGPYSFSLESIRGIHKWQNETNSIFFDFCNEPSVADSKTALAMPDAEAAVSVVDKKTGAVTTMGVKDQFSFTVIFGRKRRCQRGHHCRGGEQPHHDRPEPKGPEPMPDRPVPEANEKRHMRNFGKKPMLKLSYTNTAATKQCPFGTASDFLLKCSNEEVIGGDGFVVAEHKSETCRELFILQSKAGCVEMRFPTEPNHGIGNGNGDYHAYGNEGDDSSEDSSNSSEDSEDSDYAGYGDEEEYEPEPVAYYVIHFLVSFTFTVCACIGCFTSCRAVFGRRARPAQMAPQEMKNMNGKVQYVPVVVHPHAEQPNSLKQ